MIATDKPWRPFEPSSDVELDDEDRCAVCAWPLAVNHLEGCTRGNCSHRPRPANLYAPERAKREADELHARAVRNGMPASGRWA